jgi:hypothetical protein
LRNLENFQLGFMLARLSPAQRADILEVYPALTAVL